MMNRERFSNLIKAGVIVIGAACFGFAVGNLPDAAYSWGYFFILFFSIVIAPRLSLTIPKSRFALSFSDALIFLSFLIYGGEAAIVLAGLEMLAHCVYLKSTGFRFGKLMIATNFSSNTIYTACTFGLWLLIPHFTGISLDASKTQHLITLLGILALSQFFVSSILAAVFQSLNYRENLWTTWKSGCFSISMAQIVGAGLAGIIYKLINYGDLATAIIAFTGLTVAYVNYRQSINEVNAAMTQVEDAERAKAETERERRVEAEKHASQLGVSLKKEEQANAALRKSEKDFQHAALHDSLTGLANRKQFGDILRGFFAIWTKVFPSHFQYDRTPATRNDPARNSLSRSDPALPPFLSRSKRSESSQLLVSRIGRSRQQTTPQKLLVDRRCIANRMSRTHCHGYGTYEKRATNSSPPGKSISSGRFKRAREWSVSN